MLQRINLPRRSEGNPGLTYTRKALGEYWTEGEAYVVDSTQAEQIRLTVQVVSALFKQAMDYVIDNPNILDRFTLMGDERLDKQLRTLIKESWKKTPSYVVDRWDMAWDGTHPPKLLERNFGFLGLLMATGSVQEEYVEWLRQAAKKTNIHSFDSLKHHIIRSFQEVASECKIPDKGDVGVLYTKGNIDRELDLSGAFLHDCLYEAGYNAKSLPGCQAEFSKGRVLIYAQKDRYFSYRLEDLTTTHRLIKLLQQNDFETIHKEFNAAFTSVSAEQMLNLLAEKLEVSDNFEPFTIRLPCVAPKSRPLDIGIEGIYCFSEFEIYARSVAEKLLSKRRSSERTKTVLPYWSLLAGHKGMLAVMYELNPHHPNLLPTFWGTKICEGEKRIIKKVVGAQGLGSVIYAADGSIVSDRRDPITASDEKNYITQAYSSAVVDPSGDFRVFHVFTTNGTAAAIGTRVSPGPFVGGRGTSTRYVPVFVTPK